MRQFIRIYTLFILLCFGGITNEAWAAKVTYHILTLEINSSTANMVDAVNGKRLEAIRVIVDNAVTIQLPDHFKSPLAENFKYWADDQVEKSAVTQLYANNATKGIIYNLKATPTETTEGAGVTSDCEIYVTYTYKSSNTIADLSGSTTYIIGTTKGFLTYNRGRNNRPAVLPRANVSENHLISDDFIYIESPGISNTYWSDNNNKNPRASVEKQFHFQFKLEGSDPYNIIIRTAYSRGYTYIEKNDNVKPDEFVYKWYKGGAMFGVGSNNQYIASDDHIKYNYLYNSAIDNPTNLTQGDGTGWVDRKGNFHGQNAPIWGTFALLNNTTSTGYVFMGSRTCKADGSFDAPTGSNNNYNYYYLKFDNANLTIGRQTPANATKNYSVDQNFYEIKTVNFKVKTPFGNTVTASVKMSDYKILNNDISVNDIPSSLKRKYCSFTNFYKDAALTQEITKYSEMVGTDIYVGYRVQNTPFQAITPVLPPSSYDADTWKTATWYELTDESSIEPSGKKLKYTSPNFKNDGASGEFTKTSEYAFIGDPYELRVVLRSATSGDTPTYVGATGDAPTTGTLLTASTSATAGYKWEIPDDDADNDRFLLRLYGGEGHWNWTVGNRSEDVTYGTNKTVNGVNSLTSNAQTVTFNISGLTVADGNYIKVTKGGTDAAQVTATTPTLSTGIGSVDANGKATVTATIAANTSGADKSFTLTVTEYNSSNVVVGTATTITVTQGTTAFTGNTVEYSTASSTRVKVLELPKKTFTYKIVDRAGRIAVTASASQTIFSPLSLASIPSIIISPFIVDETITFYSSFDSGSGAGTGTSRTHLSTVITETPNANAPIYVKYTTTNLNSKPFKLSEDQEIFVRLNGQYIYYDAESGTIKSAESSGADDGYKWKLRNRDPYAMLIDNMGARTALSVSGDETITLPTDDDGTTASQSRQRGAWVDVATIENAGALSFTTTRGDAQQFIAKSSARAGVYEVMVATGDGVDASTTYYNIGRPDATTIKIYSNATYQATDDDEIKFRLEENVTYTYHLIDKAKHELLKVPSKSPELVLPAEYQSPLVGAANYSYYSPDQMTIDESKNPDEYTPTNPATKLSNLSGLDATYTKTSGDYGTNWTNAGANQMTATDVTDLDNQAKKLTSNGDYYCKVGESTYYHIEVTKPRYLDIYVTYVKNDLVTFNDNGHPYMLKFLNPYATGYHLEDGNDGLTTELIQAVYPYTNGDGNMNIYGTAMNEEQMNGGANTRPRWVWYFRNPTGYTDDPYHVTIRSRSTISYNDVSHYAYLQTYAVHFEQDDDPDTKHIVTGGYLPTIASENPTEYMILGTQGSYRLMTTNAIAADLNGDGDTEDDGENERRSVTSLEQYWKTYNMVKKEVLGIDVKEDATYKDDFSEEASTFVVPDAKRSELLTAQPNWHSYEIYAYATRWNGYNDKSDGHEKKVVEKLEHWFQTFDMGNGAFDIESANIPPVLVLLDRHGWEIMRRPLPTTTYPYGDELDALQAYDSPMVKEYHFFNNASKANGCHKYSLRIQDNALRDEIKVNGTAYTSTSLAALPPLTASGVKDGNGIFQDQYVTYTVKEEYEKSYTYTFTDNGSSSYSETGTPSKFLVLQNGRFLKKENEPEKADRKSYISKPIYEHTNPTGGNVYDLILSPRNNTVTILDGSGNIADFNFWYVGPNLDIDKEMGFRPTRAGTTEYETKKTYADKTKVDYMQTTGFDPYNLQIRIADETDNEGDPRYITTHMTSATLDNGVMVGSYDGSGGTTDVTLETGFSYAGVDPEASTGSEGHDHTNLKISNQTFMAVSDANGNMQLMPRFDHTLRVNTEKSSPYLTTLETPKTNAQTATADDNNSMNQQTTFLVRPQVFEYLIIDNEGREALRYKRTGEYYPAITEHFKSPLATNFKYYKTLSDSNSDGVYELATLADEITGSFAGSGLDSNNETVYVRYSYDEDADNDNHILQGKWFTIKLNDLDVQASGTVVETEGASQGTGVSLFADAVSPASPTKPATIDEDDKTWQWKFLQAPTDPTSEYYEAPDPYAIELYNRNANYDSDPTADPNKMDTPIKVNGTDRFSLLTHPNGGYALAVNGLGTYNYSFLNGAAMTTSVAATTTAENRQKITVTNEAAYNTAKAALTVDGEYYYKYGKGDEPLTYSYKKVTVTGGTPDAGANSDVSEWTDGDQYNFNVKVNALSPGAQLIIQDDVTHNYRYRVITNEKIVEIEEVETNVGNKLAVEATQDDAAATVHHYAPYLPEAAQTPLLNDETDYLYYGSATVSSSVYTVVPATQLFTLYGLYDDLVYVRYKAYNAETTPYLVPNEKDVDGSGKITRGSGSNDVAMNISGGLPYNIIWENNNMMQSANDDAISDGGSHALDGTKPYVWYFEGGDPYALKIKHKGGKYVDGTTTLVTEGSAKDFMLLKKSGYDYGVLQMTGTTGADAGKKLTGYGGSTTTGDTPTKFIIFGLSVHDLIYHLIIAKTCADKTNPGSGEYVEIPYMASESGTLDSKTIYGTTQRDLTSVNDGAGTHYTGEKYQLGETLEYGGNHVTYCFDAGTVSIGDVLEVPSVFYRPNCTFDFYIEGVYNTGGTTAETALNAKFKGLKLDNLMSDPELIDKTVVVNIVYQFNTELATNTGLGFVTSTDQNLWYTLEAFNAETPYLARYTNTQGLKTVAGRETRYTNDYLWTPVGDVYGFKMYNRYVLKNSSTSGDDNTRMMTTTALTDEQAVTMAVPANGYEIYELTAGDNDGYFRIHPVANTGATKYYVNQVGTDLKLGTTPSEWTWGLDVGMLQPYYLAAGNVGGLTTTPKAGRTKSGKTLYEEALAKDPVLVTDLQDVVYNDANIVDFADGYYRLHSQPGITGISPVRYASGYLHKTEMTPGTGTEGSPVAIPMHFYSRIGVTGTFNKESDSYTLRTGFTSTNATQGDIPVPATEDDPSTIFRIVGGDAITNRTITNVTLSTQGLNVIENKMGSGTATTYRLIDIGGGVVIIIDVSTNKYLNFIQTGNIYDLKYSAANADRIDDVKWCVEPADNQGLKVTMNDGGDDHYYSTFYAPFDVLLPADDGDKKYYAYICKEWHNEGVHPVPVPAVSTYDEGKFVPAGSAVIFRSTDGSSMKLSLPSSTPSSPLSSCIFSGQYLEQMLAADADHDVYTLGLPFNTEMSINRENGSITAPAPDKDETGVGFYINATPNKESDPTESMWTRNNLYVLHNKIYYREDPASLARGMTRGSIDFVPVVFDDLLVEPEEYGGEQQEEEEKTERREYVGDGCVYDMTGRRVATAEQVMDGTWKHHVSPGIYIINGKKISVN